MTIFLFNMNAPTSMTTSYDYLEVLGFYWKSIEQKIRHLHQTLLKINASVKSNPGTKIKAILVAPENFFAKDFRPGTVRQYTESEKHKILVDVKKLSEIFADIVIIPGTISWMESSDFEHARLDDYSGVFMGGGQAMTIPYDSRSAEQIRETYDDKILNCILEGEIPTTQKFLATEISKKTLDAIDKILNLGANYGASSKQTMINSSPETKLIHLKNIIQNLYSPGLLLTPQDRQNALKLAKKLQYGHNSAYIYLAGKQIAQYHKSSDFEENLSADSIIHINGGRAPVIDIKLNNGYIFKIGLEICLDHNVGVLKDYIIRNSITPPDVQIVLSASVVLKPENIIVQNGGYLVHSSSDFTQHGEYLIKCGRFYHLREIAFVENFDSVFVTKLYLGPSVERASCIIMSARLEYDNELLTDHKLLCVANKYLKVGDFDKLIDLGSSNDIAKEILLAVDELGAEKVLEILFGDKIKASKPETTQIQEQALFVKTQDDQILETIAKIEAVIGKEAFSQIAGWHQYITKSLSKNPMSEHATKVVQAIGSLIGNLEELLDFSALYEDINIDNQVTIILTQLEYWVDFVASGTTYIGLPPRYPGFDPDDNYYGEFSESSKGSGNWGSSDGQSDHQVILLTGQNATNTTIMYES